jgi:enoyl-CoA hydratase
VTDAITYELNDNIAHITLDDGKVNAMSLPWFTALDAALDQTEKDAPGAVVIAGRAGFYSAGLDLKVLPTLSPDDLRTTLTYFGRTMLRMFTFPIPMVAAVTGHAVAGGAVLMLACDARHAADGPFRLHLSEVSIGLSLPTWALVIAQSGIPQRWHTEAILHARSYSPREALDRGIVDAVAPADHLLAQAHVAAAALRRLDATAYATSKSRHRALAVKWASDLLQMETLGRTPGAKF